MHQKSTFDRLVSKLTTEQRFEMLRQIKESAATKEEQMFADTQEREYDNIEAVYSSLSVLRRIVLFLRALFTQRDVIDILEDSVLKRYAGDIERECHGVFEAKTLSLTKAFADRLEILRDSLLCFNDPLSRAFGSEKKDFIAFLAGFEIPVHQERLLEITNDETYAGREGSSANSDLRRHMLLEVAAALQDISDSDRSAVYGHIRSLYFLKELTFFPFSSILEHFFNDGPANMIPLEQIRTPLLEFGDVLISQGAPPGETALKALFLFDLPPDDQEEPGEVESAWKGQLVRAYKGISGIRTFTSALPLKKLLKVCTANLGYTPQTGSGGEDWFALYRKFWEERVETAVLEHSFKNKKTWLTRDACTLIGIGEITPLKNYQHRSQGPASPGRYETTLAFLYHFFEKLFLQRMHRVLRIFLVDGDFYKSQNREQYTSSYAGMQKTAKLITELKGDLSGGEIDDAVDQNLDQFDIRTMEARVERIIYTARDHLGLLINVVKGILYGESGGRFDTLSNISYIGGSENAKLIDRLGEVLKQTEETQRIMNELYDLEGAVID